MCIYKNNHYIKSNMFFYLILTTKPQLPDDIQYNALKI